MATASMLAVLGTAGGLAACTRTPTELVVVVNSDIPDLSSIHLTGTSSTELDLSSLSLPFSFALVPSGDPSIDVIIDVSGWTRSGPQPVADSVVVTHFVGGAILEVPMFLSRACAARAPCPAGMTCTGTGAPRCVSPNVDPGTLPAIAPGTELADAGPGPTPLPPDAGFPPPDAGSPDASGPPDASTPDASPADSGAPPADCLPAGARPGIRASWPIPPDAPGALTVEQGGLVHDDLTGLTWQQGFAGPFTATAAAAHCAALDLQGRDWRLPSRIELMTIVDYSRAAPAIDNAKFPGTLGPFWTSSPTTDPATYWLVSFDEGAVLRDPATTRYLARCVRPAPGGAPGCLVPGPNGVLDTATGLLWQATSTPAALPFGEAEAACAARGAGWRLPTIKELSSIVDETRTRPALDLDVFPDMRWASNWYWTSTQDVVDRTQNWHVSLDDGGPGANARDLPQNARCVCSGPTCH